MPAADHRRLHISALPLVVALFAILALLAPFGAAEEPLHRVGVLLAVGGGLQVLHGIRRAELASLKRAVVGGVISMLMGLLVLAAPDSSIRALVVILAVTFASDGVGYASAAARSAGRRRTLAWLQAGGDFAAALALLLFRAAADEWVFAAAAALRLFGIAWAMAVTPVHGAEDAAGTVVDDLGLGDHPEASELAARVAFEEKVRASSDRRWTIAFLIML